MQRRVGAILAWPPQLPVHSSQRKFIILFRNMNLEIGMDPMLKLLREFINPTGFAVYNTMVLPLH
jgi:hypothetical protein